jgi:WD repeat-containing protein 35
VALAVDSFIYFANIRPDYKWGSFGNTVVYAYNRRDRPEQCVVFWDTNTDERYTKFVKNLLSIHAAGENCVLATRADDNTGQHILILCNAIGSPVDSKYIDIQPKHVTMTPYHIIAASDDQIYVWHYRSSVSKLTSVDSSGSLRRREGRERVFHIDDTSSSAAGGAHRPTADAIAAISASQRYLVVGRESGALHRYTLPHISLDAKYTLRCRPAQLHLNCDSSKLGIIDIGGMLSFFDFDARGTAADGRSVKGEHLAFERKDAWSLKWAEDNPALFAVMEKTRMYIFRGTDPEEPVLSSGYLCSFKDLTVRSVMLDEVMEDPTRPDKGMVVEYEARSLRDARHLLAANSIGDASSFIEDNPHPRLWRLLAETALERQDFGSAEKAFVMLQDYQGIQFVKRLKSTENKARAAAEVATYFQRFDEAEGLYREMDRMDLAVELRMRLGDWFKVVQLLQSGAGDDDALTLAWNRIGDYYADRQKWAKAAQYYTQAKNMGALVECLYILEDYEGLEALVETLPEGSPLLSNIGRKLQSVGLNDAAVAALLRAGDVKGAVDSCVLLNQWDKAVELAQAHDLPQIETLLSKYASHLLESDSTFQAIELYRKANRSTESAKLLARLAGEAAKTRANPLRAKKLYVLAALEVERFRKRNLDMTGASSMATTVATATGTMTGTAAVTAATLDTLLAQDATAGGVGDVGAASRTLDSAWHGAEAFHWFMLAQRQLRGGLMEPAMKTAMLLVNYEDILAPADIYSLIALCAYYARHYGMCSKAFMRLEALEDVEPSVREAYEGLAMDIFTQNPPRDPSGAADLTLDVEHKPRDVCLVSGRKVTDGRYYRCSTCKHKIMKTELQGLSVCPLCHAGIV